MNRTHQGDRQRLTYPTVGLSAGLRKAETQKGWSSKARSDGRVGDRPFEAPLKRANIPLGCTMQSSIHRGIQLAPVAGNLK